MNVMKDRFFLFDAQGAMVERFVDLEDTDNKDFVYKKRCVPKDCKGCPQGSYCYNCSDCRVSTYAFNKGKPLKMLECFCKKHKYDKAPALSFVDLDNPACQKDITNCDGVLKCGTCFGTNFYTLDGELVW